MDRTRAAGALPAALPTALLVVLLCVLGAFVPASHGTPASGSPDAAGGPAATGTFRHHDATDESADGVCTSAACGTQPRLHRDTPAEQFAGPAGAAWVSLCLLLPCRLTGRHRRRRRTPLRRRSTPSARTGGLPHLLQASEGPQR